MFIEYLLLWLLFFLPLVFPPIFIDPYDLPKILFFYFCSFLLIILTSLSTFSKKILILPDKSFLKLLLLFILSYAISTIFSIHRLTSLTGIWEMYGTYTNGLIHLLVLVLIFLAILQLNLKKRGSVEKIIIYSTASTILVSLYGIYQYLQNFLVGNLNSRIRSTIGQPNRLAFFLIASLPLTISCFIKEKHPLYKTAYFLSSLFIFLAIILTFSRAAWLILFITLLVVLLSNFKNLKKITKENKIFLIVLLCLVLLIMPFQGKTVVSRITNTAKDLKNQSGSTYFRLLEAQTALNIFKDQSLSRKLIGIGPETIKFTYPQFRPIKLNQSSSEKNIQVYILNSQYLQYLNTIGLVGIIFYFLVIFSVVNIYLKVKNKTTIQKGVFYAWLTIVLSNIFYSQTIITHLYFWLETALILNFGHLKTIQFKKTKLLKISLFPIILLSLSGIVTCFPTAQSLLYARQQNFKKAATSMPIFDFLWREYSLQLHKEALDKKDTKIMEEAIEKAEKAYKLNPLESSNIAVLHGALYSGSGHLKMDKKYQERALELAQKWTQLDPSRPEPFDALGLSYLDLGQQKSALENFEKAITLDKEFLPSYLHAGEALKQMGKIEQAISYYQKVLKKQPSWPEAQQELEKAQELLDKQN